MFFFFSSLTLTNLWLGMRFGWNVITWGLAGQANNQYVPELKLNAARLWDRGFLPTLVSVDILKMNTIHPTS